MRRLLWALVIGCSPAVLTAGGGLADSGDHDAARAALQRGEVRPLAELLTAVRDKLPGEVVGVEIERKDGRWFYEFRVAGKGGRLFEVYVDARTGDIARIKEK